MIKRNDEGQRNAKQIEELTRGQSSCGRTVEGRGLWEDEREWRLTASRFGPICKATERRNMISLAKTILHPPHLTNDAVVYGRTKEEIAAQEFSAIKGLVVLPCGLFIDEKYSYLAASPDGVVGQDALIEVKCPYSQRDSKISAAPHLFSCIRCSSIMPV